MFEKYSDEYLKKCKKLLKGTLFKHGLCEYKVLGISVSNFRRVRHEWPPSPLQLMERLCSVLFLKRQSSLYKNRKGKVEQLYEGFI